MAQTYKGCLCALLQYHSATIKEYVPQHGPLMLQGQLVNVSIAIPSFTPTSNPQFDELLADLRHRVFMPAALSPQHRNLVFRQRHVELLNKDPGITVTMDDGEEIRLRPRNYYDMPSSKVYMKQFLSQLENSTSTWNNVFPFLQGLTMTRVRIPRAFWETLTRKAGENGKEGILVDCARSADKTEFRLCRPGVAREFFIAFHRQAAASGFKGAKMEVAYKRAQNVALMLESQDHLHLKPRHVDESHGGETKPDDEPVDARSDALVLATLLELSAHTALKELPDSLRKTVASYAAKLALVIQDAPSAPSPTVDSNATTNREKKQELASLSRDLEAEVIVQDAIETALKVGSVERADEAILKNHLQILNKKVEEKVQILREESEATGRSRRSLTMYDQLRSPK